MSTLQLRGCTVDLGRRSVRGETGDLRPLTTREVDLLRYLALRPSTPVSRDELLAQVWGYSDAVVSRVCDNTVHRLRDKIEVDPARPDHLITVHGTGYRLELGPAEPVARPTPPASEVLVLGEATVDLGRARSTVGERTTNLTGTEVLLLRRLDRAAGAVVPRATLLRDVWGNARLTGRALDHAVRRLRAKVELDPSEPRLLLAGGGGYRLEVPSPPRPDDRIGRQALAAALADATRTPGWTLLVGPPGVGKTTLARDHAARCASTWVDAGACRTADNLVAAVAAALRVPTGSDPARQVGRALAARGAQLVVLDTLEHAAAVAGSVLEGWLALAPATRFLGTSRARFAVQGERVLEVEPLAEDAAVALFVLRAGEASRAVRFDPAATDDVRALVRRLGCLPLSIELAAARSPVLSPRELLARIEVRLFNVLLPLKTVIADAVSLLGPDDLAALLALALFRTPFTVDDAEALLGPSALDQVQSLRDHSLLQARPRAGGGITLLMLDAVREHADALRIELPDRGHAAILAHVTRLADGGSEATFLRLDERSAGPERERHRAAVDAYAHAARLATEIREPELAAACARAALRTWRIDGASGPALRLCGEILAMPAPPSLTRGWLALATAQVCLFADRRDEAAPYFARALETAEALGYDVLLGETWAGLAGFAGSRGDAAERTRCYTVAHTHAARTRFPAWSAQLASRAIEGSSPDRAEALLLEGLEQCGADLSQRALILSDLSRFAWRAGRLAEAEARGLEAIACQRALGVRLYLPSRHGELVLIAQERGDLAAAETLGEAGLALAREMGMPTEEALILGYRGSAELVCGRLDRARALLSDARTLLESGIAPRGLAYVELRLAEVHLASGDARSAADLARRATERNTRIGDPWNAACCESLLALARAVEGHPTEALPLAEHALEVLLALANPLDQLVGWCRLGQVAALAGDTARAGRCTTEAEALARSHGLDRDGTEGRAALAALRAIRVFGSP